MKNLTEYINESKKVNMHPTTKKELEDLLWDKVSQDHWGDIDTSKITDMSELFTGSVLRASQYETIDISKWDVSNVIDMSYMFDNADIANLDLSKWDIRNVKNMKAMFRNCIVDHTDLSGWDVSHVENMDDMFSGAVIDEDIHVNNWDVSNVKSMKGMFEYNSDYKYLPKWYKK